MLFEFRFKYRCKHVFCNDGKYINFLIKYDFTSHKNEHKIGVYIFAGSVKLNLV